MSQFYKEFLRNVNECKDTDLLVDQFVAKDDELKHQAAEIKKRLKTDKKDETLAFLRSKIMIPVVAIVGSSGRNEEEKLFTDDKLYHKMVDKAQSVIVNEFKLKKFALVSGGAAWSDHVAVSLFLMEGAPCLELNLHLPCKFENDQFENSREGIIANELHRVFSKKIGHHSLKEIQEARSKAACQLHTHSGFLASNTEIAQSADYLIAFSWSRVDAPTKGGTLDTWNKFGKGEKKRKHISLYSL